jgi:hypothetical protein
MIGWWMQVAGLLERTNTCDEADLLFDPDWVVGKLKLVPPDDPLFAEFESA